MARHHLYHCPWTQPTHLQPGDGILKLRRRLTDMEKRIAAMRMAFDQQHQDLVDAASKALSYRHEILEEKVRLTYALQAAEQERSIFVSSLLPLLAEYEIQPSVNDAHSIVSNVKVLIQHLREKLNFSEAKLKDSQYHLTSWRADPVYQSPYLPQSPFHPNSDHLQPSKSNGLEIVPQTVLRLCLRQDIHKDGIPYCSR